MRFYNPQTELTRQIVALRSRSDFGDGEAACSDDKNRSTEFCGVGAHDEPGRVLNFLDFGIQKDLNISVAALGFQHVGDVLGGAVAEKLAEGFLMVRNAMFFYQSDEIQWRITG